MAESERVAVRFDRATGIYNAGEVAGFSREVARAYVEAGAAHYEQPQTPAQSAAQAQVVAERADDPRSDPLAFAKDKEQPKKRGR